MSTVIDKTNMSNFVVNGSFDIAASVKPEQGSAEKKNVTLRFVMSGTPLSDIIQSSLKDKRINWQTGARTKFNSIKSGSVIEVKYEGGRAPADPRAVALAYFSSLSDEEKEELLGK